MFAGPTQNELLRRNRRTGSRIAPLEITPSTGTVLKQSFLEGFSGAGSYAQDKAAATIERELQRDVEQNAFSNFFTSAAKVASGIGFERQGTPLTNEEYQQSEYFREGLEYLPGLTDVAAQVRAERFDKQSYRNYLADNASGFQNAAGFLAAIAGSIFDIKNISVETGAVLATGGASNMIRFGSKATRNAFDATTGVKRAIDIGKNRLVGAEAAKVTNNASDFAVRTRRAHQFLKNQGVLSVAKEVAEEGASSPTVYRVATEGVVGSLPIALGATSTSEITGEEYTLTDAMVEIGASAGLATTFHGIAKGFSRLWDKYASSKDYEELANIALSQIISDGRVDVEAVKNAQVADRLFRFSSVDEDRINAPDVVRQADDSYVARIPEEEGVMRGVVARGATEAEAVANLQNVYRSPDSKQLIGPNAPDDYAQVVKAKDTLEDQMQNFDRGTRIRELARTQGVEDVVEEFDNATQARAALREETEKLASEIDKVESQGLDVDDVLQQRLRETRGRLGAASRRVNELRETQVIRDLSSQVEEVRQGLKRQYKDLTDRQLKLQRDTAKADLEQMYQRQKEIADRGTDMEDRISRERIAEQANGVNNEPIELSENVARIRRELEEVDLESDQVSARDKTYIRTELDAVDQVRDDWDKVTEYIKCLGK